MSCWTRDPRCTCVLLGGNGRAVALPLQPRPVAALLRTAHAVCPRLAQAASNLREQR
jgi:hypothetical protein